MDRRTFLGTLTGGLLAAPLAAEAQPVGMVWRIGRLSPSFRETDAPLLDAFRKGIREFGWIDGQTFTVEDRFAEGKSDRLPNLSGGGASCCRAGGGFAQDAS